MWNSPSFLLTIVEIILLAKSQLIREDQFRSSSVRTTENYMLHGYSFHKQRSYDILDCAHACLSQLLCLSFNFYYGGAGDCYLNSRTAVGVEQWLLFKQGYTYGELQNMSDPAVVTPGDRVPVVQYTFTCLGTKGSYGPVSTAGYNSTNLENSVRLDNGKQIWTVPKTGKYIIEGYGASGADGFCKNDSVVCHKGGLGAKISGTFDLIIGSTLTILVGQKGQLESILGQFSGGGGGGTFVVYSDVNTTLIVAGGGGGGGGGKPLIGHHDGDPGQAYENGSRCGGTSGMGGRICNFGGSKVFCSSGAGFLGNGESIMFTGPMAYSNGGFGGMGTSDKCVGGYGGGGYGMLHAGGGGGYSGGGNIGNTTTATAGGGGSYNSGTFQENKSGINKGNGKVIIKMR